MTTLSPPGSARPTMVDVAREAEVSLKTVSRVVNGEARVRPETARKVHRVIERLGFQRNDSASQLRRGTSASIGLVVEDLSNPFYSQLGAAVEREAGREGHLLITASAEGDPERESALVAAGADGSSGRRPRRGAGGGTAPPRSWHRGSPVVYVDRPVRTRPPTTCSATTQAASARPSSTWPRVGTAGSASSVTTRPTGRPGA